MGGGRAAAGRRSRPGRRSGAPGPRDLQNMRAPPASKRRFARFDAPRRPSDAATDSPSGGSASRPSRTHKKIGTTREITGKCNRRWRSFVIDVGQCSVDSVQSAAALVARGAAQSFHVVLEGVRSLDVALPDLGVFVFPDQLALDYRMGSEWTPARVEAFFALLADLAALDPRASTSLQECSRPEEKARFQSAWQRYVAEGAA